MPQSFTSLNYHIIFGTKERRPLLTPDLRPRLYAYLGGIVRNDKGVLLAAGGTEDHIHLLASLNKERSVADVLRLIKTNSSRWIHDTFSDQKQFAWQAGYAAFAVSYSNLTVVKRYIENQQEHHRQRNFREEFTDLLRKHHVDFDERYL